MKLAHQKEKANKQLLSNSSSSFIQRENLDLMPKVRVEILHGPMFKPVPQFYQINPILNHPIDEIFNYSENVQL